MLKVVAQKSMALAPSPNVFARTVKTHLLKSYSLRDTLFQDRLVAACRHRRHYDEAASRPRAPRVLEIGTGAFPIIALAQRLLGSPQVTILDVVPLITSSTLEQTLRAFARAAADGRLEKYLPVVDDGALADVLSLARKAKAMPVEDVLAALGIVYRICPSDDLASSRLSVDLVTSYAVLEFVGRDRLGPFMEVLTRILRKGGVQSHWIDLGDEYAYFDKRLSPLNFLRYPDATWAHLDNPLCRTDRMRMPDYRSAMTDAGFAIVGEDTRVVDAERGGEVRICDRFAGVSAADIRVVSAWLWARNQVGGASRRATRPAGDAVAGGVARDRLAGDAR